MAMDGRVAMMHPGTQGPEGECMTATEAEGTFESTNEPSPSAGQEREHGLRALGIAGYSDPLCVQRGEPIEFMVTTTAASYRAELVRFVGDAGGRVRSQPLGELLGRAEHGREQRLAPGSFVEVNGASRLAASDCLEFLCWIWPARAGCRQALVSVGDESGPGWTLALSPELTLELTMGGRSYGDAEPLPLREWSLVGVTLDRTAERLAVRHTVCTGVARGGGGRSEYRVELGRPAPATRVLLAAEPAPDGGTRLHYDGKLDSPRFLATAVDEGEWERVAAGEDAAELGREVLLALDTRVAPGQRLPDLGRGGLHGVCRNGPTRAVTGRRWTGAEVDWRRVPREYTAIHFHDDDLDDAGWSPDIEWTVPADLATGAYALRVETDTAVDEVPFVVHASPQAASSHIAVLLPTFSYLAYANEHSSWSNPTFEIPGVPRSTIAARATALDRAIHAERLKSLYELHADGSGVCMSSSRRPILNMRPQYQQPIIGGPHQFSADLRLLGWLDGRAYRYDVLTDHGLDRFGAALLEGFRVVILATHPEYWSGRMLSALHDFRAGGGRIMYLGGNGLYWVTSVDPERPWVIEVRRGHVGTRSWSSAPGETHHQTTGEPGGIWRDRGWAPQRSVGVGFTAQGFTKARPYAIDETASRRPEVGFLLSGVDGSEPIGGYGSVLGGAAGYEMDRADETLGTPPNAVRIGAATGFDQSYQAVSEEIEVSDSLQNDPSNPRVRSDLVYFAGERGSAVLSVGSIAWCGALAHDDGDNDIARLTANALDAFSSASWSPGNVRR
jgi:N,N-dimethylformamidase